jgi:DNA-binding NarL/FixJ family response regulator
MATADKVGVGNCPECGSTDKGMRYSLTPQIMDGNPLARFCQNAWHNPPEMHRQDEFTPHELTVILALSLGMRHKDIEENLGMAEQIVQQCRSSISDKAGVSGRPDLYQFVRDALNAELQRRRS